MPIKKWNGKSWVDAKVKRYNGKSWVDANVKRKSSSAWSDSNNTVTKTKTWTASWTRSYSGTGGKRTGSRAFKLSHGYYPAPESWWGILRSLCGFPDMRAELKGSEIIKVELYLHNEHFYYWAGGKVGIGYHNHASEPATFSHSKYKVLEERYNARGQAKWITMPKSFGEGIRDGKYKGFSTYTNTTNMLYYGIFYGAKDGRKAPKLRITYKK